MIDALNNDAAGRFMSGISAAAIIIISIERVTRGNDARVRRAE